MNDLEKRGRGRPKTGEAMKCRFQMFMDDDLSNRLGSLSARTGLTRADILREGFNLIEKLKLAQLPDEVEDDYYEGYDDYYVDDFDESNGGEE